MWVYWNGEMVMARRVLGWMLLATVWNESEGSGAVFAGSDAGSGGEEEGEGAVAVEAALLWE